MPVMASLKYSPQSASASVRERGGGGGFYFKELAQRTVEVGKSEICRTGQQTGNSGRISVSLLVQETVVFPFKEGLQLIE